MFTHEPVLTLGAIVVDLVASFSITCYDYHRELAAEKAAMRKIGAEGVGLFGLSREFRIGECRFVGDQEGTGSGRGYMDIPKVLFWQWYSLFPPF